MLRLSPAWFPPTRPELLRLEYPSEYVQAKVAELLPLALTWYEQMEQMLYPLSHALSAEEQAIALKLSVQAPEQVSVAILDEFPIPASTALQQFRQAVGFSPEAELAHTFGSVILMKPKARQDPKVLLHELVHVSQIQRLGRAAFIERYLYELEIVGYARAPLELEAYAQQALI